MIGDDIEDIIDTTNSTAAARPLSPLTSGYIKAVAGHDDTLFVAFPILQVPTPETKYRDTAFHANTFGKKKIGGKKVDRVLLPGKFTHIHLVDGNGNQMLGRMAVHLTGLSRYLKEGDILKLQLFTELNYNVRDNPNSMPLVFISKYEKVWWDAIFLTQKQLPIQLHAHPMLKNLPTQEVAKRVRVQWTQRCNHAKG